MLVPKGLVKAVTVALWLTLAGASQAQIKLGVAGPTEGANAPSMLEVLRGAQLYMDFANKTGGVGGVKVEIVARNDDFKVDKTVEAARKLIEEDKVTALFLVRGTPHNQALLPLLEQYQVPLIAPSTGATVFHEPVNKYVFNVRTAYRLEAEKLVKLLHTTGVSRIGVLHVGDGFGKDVLVGLEKGFAGAGLQPVLVREFDRDLASKDTMDFMAPVLQDLVKSDAQVFVVVGAGLAVKNAVAALREGGSGARIATVSNNASTGFIKLLGPNADGVIVSQVFPNERTGSTPLVREALNLAKQQNLELTPAMMEGYAAAKVVVQGLRHAGRKPTRESLQKALENMKEFDLGGVTVGYSPTDHTGLTMTDLSIIKRGAFQR